MKRLDMKKLFDEELSLTELKSMMKRFAKKQDSYRLWIAFVLSLIAIAAIVMVVIKIHSKCDGYCCDDFDNFDDDFDDDELEEIDGCCDKDFED